VKGNLLDLIVIVFGVLAPLAGFFNCATAADFADSQFLFDESSIVRGSGEISIKGSFHDHAVDSSGWMKGYGSINFESLRNMNKTGRTIDFTQKADLVFTGGQLKNRKSLKLPLFEKGIGASASERFNLSHVDKSESSMIRSVNRFNNTMVYNTALAFEGLWGIKNMRGWSINMNRKEELYSGSFQTQKKIEFNDNPNSQEA
jgi:hypothetical protein